MCETKHTIAWTLAPVRPTHAEVWRVPVLPMFLVSD